MTVVEFITTPQLLQGPRAAMCDAFGLLNLLATQLGREAPLVSWRNWAAEDPAVQGSPEAASAHQETLPDIAVFSGWISPSGPNLRTLAERDRAAGDRLRDLHARGCQVVAFHTGVGMLAHAGLLRGREAALPWAYLGVMKALEPELRLTSDRPWTESGGVWTAASPSSAGEVAHDLLARGPAGDLAVATREVLLPSPDRQLVTGNLVGRITPVRKVGQVELARRHIEQHFHETLDLQTLAEIASMSVRTLLRQFRQHFGTTPVQMVHRLRISTARMLLQTTYHQIDHVADVCGWHSTAMMRRVFKASEGMTPDEYRKRFGLMPPRTLQGRT